MIALDASAILAVLHNELGSDKVIEMLCSEDSTMSTANYSEVRQKLAFNGLRPELADLLLDAADTSLVELTAAIARTTAELHEHAPALSLADRSCFAVARIFGARALTSDRIWARYAPTLGVEVDLIRAA